MYTCVYVYLHVYTCTYIFLSIHKHVCIYIYMHIYIYVYIYTVRCVNGHAQIHGAVAYRNLLVIILDLEVNHILEFPKVRGAGIDPKKQELTATFPDTIYYRLPPLYTLHHIPHTIYGILYTIDYLPFILYILDYTPINFVFRYHIIYIYYQIHHIY